MYIYIQIHICTYLCVYVYTYTHTEIDKALRGREGVSVFGIHKTKIHVEQSEVHVQ